MGERVCNATAGQDHGIAGAALRSHRRRSQRRIAPSSITVFLFLTAASHRKNTAPAANVSGGLAQACTQQRLYCGGGRRDFRAARIAVAQRRLPVNRLILAHAMGHIALRHPTVGMTQGELAQVEVQVASRSMPDEAPERVRAVALKRFEFDRACETAADVYAVKLLHDAGADPGTLVEYLRTLLPVRRPKNLQFIRRPRTRIAAAQAAITHAQAITVEKYYVPTALITLSYLSNCHRLLRAGPAGGR